MAERFYWNDDWKFAETFEEEMMNASYDVSKMQTVRIPHTVKETPLHYFDESSYQMVSAYRRVVSWEDAYEGKRLFFTMEGVAHIAEVYLNGELLSTHRCGYTAFTTDLSGKLKKEEHNILLVKVDSREDRNIPPFGLVVDYMTFGGIYRDCYLDIKDQDYIEDVFAQPSIPEDYKFDPEEDAAVDGALSSVIRVHTESDQVFLRQSIIRIPTNLCPVLQTEGYGRREFLTEVKAADGATQTDFAIPQIRVWDLESPVLYEAVYQLLRDGEVIDEKRIRIGFRRSIFRPDGYYLNGRKIKIRGLNRHQSYPYAGYAMPESMQREDARILKRELAVNAVRTSHYPQSQYFINECDEIGLLVLMEIPGWQYVGDDEWKAQAIENEHEMIVQYRNHPSIMLWGVRINESKDDDPFYQKTNEIAHQLDPTRQTGGIRANKRSSLLEDVYTYNDFSHDGKTPGCEGKSAVTSDSAKPYLVTEYCGHMYPTKAFDAEEHRKEHAIRHATVLDAIASYQDIAGSFGWCMFDYNTHKDFGSGDRICYHGVMDMFRNPKLAAEVYHSQQENEPVLAVSSSMDIGEHPACVRNDTWIITNADSVRMYKNDIFIKEFQASDSPFKHMAHGPILLDDYIGNRIKEGEDFSDLQADQIKLALNTAAIQGLSHLPFKIKMIAVKMMLFYHMKADDAVDLYQKYIGDWGGKVTSYKFEAIKDGRVVRTLYRKPVDKIRICTAASHTELAEKTTYDVASIRITATDESRVPLPFYGEPIMLSTEGPIEIIGPKVTAFRGGMAGTYVRTLGSGGPASLTISVPGQEDTVIHFKIKERMTRSKCSAGHER